MRISGFGSLGGIYGSSSGSARIRSLYGSSRAQKSSYAQLLKARYGSTNTSKRLAGSKVSNSTNASRNKLQSMYNDMTTVKGDAEDLTRAVDKLNLTGKDNVFEKKAIKQSDGTTVTDYDKDAIYSAVNNFVENYNDTLKNASVSSDRNVANAATSMSRTTSILSKSLAKIGITAGKDGKLSLDEKEFKDADMDTVKSLFQGSGSFAGSFSYAAARIQRAANTSLASMTASMNTVTSGIYGRGGYFGSNGYSALGNFFNGYF